MAKAQNVTAALGSLSAVDTKVIEALRIIRARYSEEHVDIVLALTHIAPNAAEHVKRLPAAAYRKGLLAGLAYDSTDGKYPECPYDARQLPNFLSGGNDPRTAWRDGSRDGLRIREIVLWPQKKPWPALQHREYKMLTPELQRAHDARESQSAATTTGV